MEHVSQHKLDDPGPGQPVSQRLADRQTLSPGPQPELVQQLEGRDRVRLVQGQQVGHMPQLNVLHRQNTTAVFILM